VRGTALHPCNGPGSDEHWGRNDSCTAGVSRATMQRSIARSVGLQPQLYELQERGRAALAAGAEVEVVNLGDQRFWQARPDPLQLIRLGLFVR
jgi:hypothetical protein